MKQPSIFFIVYTFIIVYNFSWKNCYLIARQLSGLNQFYRNLVCSINYFIFREFIKIKKTNLLK